ncbi:MAG TPA: DUF2889 domain-containing protein [Sphingopyxis sp.]|nr:DUF2889 domain-containing protein [Sphingopyxis sp.]
MTDQLDPASSIDSRKIFERTLRLEEVAKDHVQAWLEDDFHHFGVDLFHRQGKVVDVAVDVRRLPWTTCPAAGAVLKALIGQALDPRAYQLSTRIRINDHCTHMFELAALLMAHALRGSSRIYQIQVYERSLTAFSTAADPRLIVRLVAEGQIAAEWELHGEIIIRPKGLTGQHIIKEFRLLLDRLDPQVAEQAWIMRRAAWLALGDKKFVAMPTAAGHDLEGVCYTYQSPRSATAYAVAGSRQTRP